jgi:hypothetical protein
VKHHIAASTVTVLALSGGALGVAALGAAPAVAASCSTVTVSSSGPLSSLTLSVSSVTLTQGGCVTFHNSTSETAKVDVDGSAVATLGAGGSGGKWSASNAGAHVASATVSGLLNLPKPGVGTITVTPKPTPPPVPTTKPTNPTSGGGSGGSGGSGGTGGSGGSGGSGSSGGSGGTSHSGGSHGSGTTGHKGTSKTHHRGPGKLSTGGLLSGGNGFSLPSIPLGTFSREGLAGMGDGTTPQLAPAIGASTDAAANPLPLVNSNGAQQMALAGQSQSSGDRSAVPAIIAAVLILGSGAAAIRFLHRRAVVDGGDQSPAHRA